MGNMTKTRCGSLAVASIMVAIALARCNDSPIAPTESDPPRAEGSAPIACFTTEPDPPEIAARESVMLDASCSITVGSAASFQWELGDGQSATGRSVEARYRRSGEYTVKLSVSDRGVTSEMTTQVRVRQRPKACFVYQQVIENDPEPCTVAFDATCSSGSVKEYRWFFEGGLRPDIPLPDTNITTTEPQITYSWGLDEECFSFRHFDRIVRLTVVDEGGTTDTHEETIVFSTPILRPYSADSERQPWTSTTTDPVRRLTEDLRRFWDHRPMARGFTDL